MLWTQTPQPAKTRSANDVCARAFAGLAKSVIGVMRLALSESHEVCRRWFGEGYDLDAWNLVLAAAAVERLDGDPLWVLVVSGSGNAKTETVQALDGVGAIVTSTISSQGALLSATAAKDKAKDASGGLLRKIGHSGVLVVKDMTSILSMSGDARAEVVAALREIHDGRWERNVGTDGGRTLEWRGRIVVVAACTTAWDRAHNVIAQMGERFVLLRVDSSTGRSAAGRQAIGNVGSEVEMRTELAQAAATVLGDVEPSVAVALSESEADRLLLAADLVTRARTGVDYDYRGDVIDAHAPEMPTRFAKELAQVVRGGVAIGMDRADAVKLAIRCARDSMPPLRLAIIDDLAKHPTSPTRDVRKRLGKPRATVDRQLQALHMLDVIDVDEIEEQWQGKSTTVWRYSLAEGIAPSALDPARTAMSTLGNVRGQHSALEPPEAASPLPDSAACTRRRTETGPRTGVIRAGAAESGKGTVSSSADLPASTFSAAVIDLAAVRGPICPSCGFAADLVGHAAGCEKAS
jgi:cellobiose-specific phosphotransferase system component IIA